MYIGGIYARIWCCPTCGIENVEKFYIVVLWIKQFLHIQSAFSTHKMLATLKNMPTLIFAHEKLK